MKKLAKKNLDELAKIMPLVSQQEQGEILGGGTGTQEDPYSYSEFQTFSSSGNWNGGYVESIGYVEAGRYVNQDDINKSIAENWNPITGAILDLFQYLELGQLPVDINNYYQYQKIENYLSNNDSIYRTTITYVSNLGNKIEKETYFDKNGNVIAEIINK